MLLVTLLQIDKLGTSRSKEWIYCLYFFIVFVFFFKTVELSVNNVLKKLTQHGFSATKWQDLAASLGQGSAVEEIKTDVSGGSSAKLNALVTYWLDNDGEPSWKNLVRAMEWSKQRVAAQKLALDIGIPYPVKE